MITKLFLKPLCLPAQSPLGAFIGVMLKNLSKSNLHNSTTLVIEVQYIHVSDYVCKQKGCRKIRAASWLTATIKSFEMEKLPQKMFAKQKKRKNCFSVALVSTICLKKLKKQQLENAGVVFTCKLL